MPFNYPVHLGGYLKDVRLQSGLGHPPMFLTFPFFLEFAGQYSKNSYLFFPPHMSLLGYDATYL